LLNFNRKFRKIENVRGGFDISEGFRTFCVAEPSELEKGKDKKIYRIEICFNTELHSIVFLAQFLLFHGEPWD
jgi:hypothetical protein